MAASLAAALGGACFGERARPAPPRLELIFDQMTVRSPGRVTGTIRASDPDGIDSVWIAVGPAEQGADGFFERVFQAPFDMPIEAGLDPASLVEVRLWGRDLAGFSDTLWDTVTVIP